MFTKLRFALIVGAIAAVGAAAPAFAQSFDPSAGTGNAASCYYDRGGTLQVAIPGAGQNQVATGQSGASAFAYVPGAAGDASCNPASTGGGSVGYNQKLLQD